MASDPDTYMSIRCVIPADLEEELPELLASWGVLGTEIGGHSNRGVIISVYLSWVDSGDVDGVCRLLTDKGARDIERESLDAADWLAGFRESRAILLSWKFLCSRKIGRNRNG